MDGIIETIFKKKEKKKEVELKHMRGSNNQEMIPILSAYFLDAFCTVGCWFCCFFLSLMSQCIALYLY